MNNKLLVLMILITGILISLSGCVTNTSNTSTSKEVAQTSSSNNITMQELEKAIEILQLKCDASLTSDGCKSFLNDQVKLFEDKIDKHYLVGEGTIKDVRDGIVYLVTPSKFKPQGTIYPDDGGTLIALNNVPSNKVSKLTKGEKISFRGQILLKNSVYDTRKQINILIEDLPTSKFALYNGEIYDSGKFQSNAEYVTSDGAVVRAILTPTPISTPTSIPKSSEIQYYIDTSPPGEGIVYINDKISPTTGTLSPGSYTFILKIGDKGYVFPTISLSEGHPKVEIIIGKDKITCSFC